MSTIAKSRRGLAVLAALGVMALAAGPGIAAPPDAKQPRAPVAPARSNAQVRHFSITASDGGIIPGHVRIRLGETIRLTFKSRDDTYGIRFKDFDIKEKLTPEKPVVIELTPNAAGTYEFRCSRPWGVSRLGNKNGALVVTE